MADNRSMNTCVILLALIACSHALLWAEGRQLKIMEKEETAKHGSKNINFQQNSGELKEDSLSTKPSVDNPSAENAVSVTGKKEIYPPMRLVESAASDTDDFRPTTPGNSPGAGHKHAFEGEEELDSRVKGDESTTVTAAIAIESPPPTPTLPFGARPTPKHADGFRPTAPGHNPRVGHAIQN
ncbi:precursor of CEP9-like [Mangifera indica]|uniref:precursor of CEP9-like n=1 Tax=Mangifera indica TaxID=29780 RepID=UPI001CFB5CF6|nr:precursor of CEP9-like [Mangifera indica]